jgi:hypothetical protein
MVDIKRNKGAEDQRSNHGSSKLSAPVEETTNKSHLAGENQGPGDSRVDVTLRKKKGKEKKKEKKKSLNF